MKTISIILMSLASLQVSASNYPNDYCRAQLVICSAGAGIVAKVSSACSTSKYVFGYKKSGQLGSSDFIDAVVMIPEFNSKKNLRITPDWNNLGFLTAPIEGNSFSGPNQYESFEGFSVAFSDGRGNWDSNNGANYKFPVGWRERSENCTSTLTNQNFWGEISYSVWDMINDALRK